MTASTNRAAVDDATALEAEAAAYPDQRGEILLEAALAWIDAGRVERAEELLDDLIADGGEDGAYARVELAELLLGLGRAEEAHAQLSALAKDPELHDGHCTMAAELLAEKGDLHGALRWYDRIVARLTPDEIEALRGPAGWVQLSAGPLLARRRIRTELGLSPDATDELAPTVPEDPFGLRGLWPREIRMLTFQRAERADARRRWPDVYPGSDEDYYRAAERRWREVAEQGVPAIRVVPAIVSELVTFAERAGGSPIDPELKERYSMSVPTERTLPWPPPRNAPCWCGSRVKYKKCCGRAG